MKDSSGSHLCNSVWVQALLSWVWTRAAGWWQLCADAPWSGDLCLPGLCFPWMIQAKGSPVSECPRIDVHKRGGANDQHYYQRSEMHNVFLIVFILKAWTLRLPLCRSELGAGVRIISPESWLEDLESIVSLFHLTYQNQYGCWWLLVCWLVQARMKSQRWTSGLVLRNCFRDGLSQSESRIHYGLPRCLGMGTHGQSRGQSGMI